MDVHKVNNGYVFYLRKFNDFENRLFNNYSSSVLVFNVLLF